MLNNNRGFTLIEVLIALGIAGVVLTAAYSTFMSQNNSYKRMEQITAMQQNLRAALTFMSREIRMAGADPLSMGNAGIVTADDSTLNFTSDVSGGATDGIDNDDDGYTDEADEERFSDGDLDDPNENITYTLYDAYGDGDMDIGRNTGSGFQPLAENINTLNFVYLTQVDQDGDGIVPDELPTPVSDPSIISAVRITIEASTERGDRQMVASTTLKFRNINP